MYIREENSRTNLYDRGWFYDYVFFDLSDDDGAMCWLIGA